jgi:hypothetical protein
LAATALLVIGGLTVTWVTRSDTALPPSTSVTPCASPFMDANGARTIPFPTAGGIVRATVRVGDSVFVGWSRCRERGRWTTSDRRDERANLVSFEAAGDCCKGNPTANLELVGYHAREVGTVTLVGRGNQGSHGSIVIHIDPGLDGLTAEPLPTPHSYLKEAERSKPRASSCPKVLGPVVTLVLGPRTFSPACTAVTPIQQLRVQNQSGKDTTLTYGRYPPRVIRAGQTYTFNLKFGHELAFGVHDVPLSIYPTQPELWVYVG